MKKFVALCVFLTGMGMALSPAHAKDPALLAADFPKAGLMIVFTDTDDAANAQSRIHVQGCGAFSLLTLVDYSEGKNRAVALPWNHKVVAGDEWKRMEGWVRSAVAVRYGAAGLLPENAPKAVFYEVSPGAAGAVLKAETGEEVQEILNRSKVPAISKYILENERRSWWPPTTPEEVPTL